MQNSHDKFIYQKNPFYSSVTCRLALCKKCLKLNWFEGVLYAKSNEGWSRKNQILKRNSKKQKCRTLFPHWTENNSPYHSAASEGCTVSLLHRVFQCVFTNTEPSDEREGRSTQGWESSRWMHERLITFLPVEPRLYKRRAWSGKTRNKGFPNNTKSQIGASRIFHCYYAYSCSSSNFKHFFFCCTCPPANSMYSVVVRSREK